MLPLSISNAITSTFLLLLGSTSLLTSYFSLPAVGQSSQNRATDPLERVNQQVEQLNQQIDQIRGGFTTKSELETVRQRQLEMNQTLRQLADLLLRQNRIVEAQQVVDFLKVQELDNYFRKVQKPEPLPTPTEPKVEVVEKYHSLQQSAIQLGRELTALRQIPDRNRTPQQQQRIRQLVAIEEDLNKQFNEFIRSVDVAKLLQQINQMSKNQNVKLEDFNALRDDLRRLNAVLFYPLVLDDRLELIITTPDSAPLRRTVKVRRQELIATIVAFRRALQDSTRLTEAKARGQVLYNWLIKPLEPDFKQANTQTIIYAPDGPLRYIPLAALYDGQQWLVQRFRTNNITAKSLTQFSRRSQSKLRILAGAFVQGTYEVALGNRQVIYAGLPFASKEVTDLAALMPGTTKLVDGAFNLAAVKAHMNEYNILHFATHAVFMPGEPENSFILFGNGDRATLRDIENWSLQNVDFVVLSACETGVGGQLGNGEEILGLGYQFQNRGATATIATLWAVKDDSTSILMSSFYASLSKGINKVEALQQAQIKLITHPNYRHPLHWAPFILIGNGM
ncbi:MAG: CHAT domain-containing protein [Leptolyngbyaceae cyanobacterium bins.302]|nr:CHAT domain-containing protein [Leptolyngbyaceae cyanobacterium bins.302]